ncbi:MAG: ACT domain-containing protein, partial [Armatimonadota bacterium]|nr:ACT domain-containing protein [Armatimonadota bacterium]
NLQKVLASFKVQNEDDLFASIGYGHIAALTVVHRLTAAQPPPPGLSVSGKRQPIEAKLGIVANGVDGVAIRRAKCCAPIPGDEIVGYVTRGRGVALHRKCCPNIAIYYKKEPDRMIDVEWTHADSERFQAGLFIKALDRVGLLNDISAIFSESKTNISSARIGSSPDKTAYFDLTVEVSDVDHLNRLINSVASLNDVLEVRRTSISGKE